MGLHRCVRPFFLTLAVTTLGCRSAQAAVDEPRPADPAVAVPAVPFVPEQPEASEPQSAAPATVSAVPGFLVLAEDPRVQHEAGARDFARAIAAQLDPAFERAQDFHQLEFSRFPPIRVFATRESYADATLSPGGRGSCVLGVVCFSPKLYEQRATLPGVVLHELSHALLLQNVGLWVHNTKIPAWFREGLATLASDGAGAEGCTPEAALADVAAGRGFDFESSVARLRGIPEGVSAYAYYRQTSLFVAWLRGRDVARFHAFLSGLRSTGFQEGFAQTFAATPIECWNAWAESLRE